MHRIRNFQRERDANFVFATWLNSYEPFRDKNIAEAVYYHEHHDIVEQVMKAGGLVSHIEGEPDQLSGYLFGSGKVLDYVFVKPMYRKLGVGTALVQAFGLFDAYTHHTKFSRYLIGKAIYDPYLQRRFGNYLQTKETER